MIISHKYRYLFVEIPFTASTAISAELRQNYAGESILYKHAHLHEFMAQATPDQKKYFVFAGVRNPLDAAVSVYYKQKTDHQSFFTDPAYRRSEGGHVSDFALERYAYIQAHPDDFGGYLRKFYRIPYDSYGSVAPGEYDFMIRFEHLQDDFAQLLKELDIEQVRPLPAKNKTGERADDFYAYYTPDTWEHVRRIFGPFLKQWGYRLPSDDQHVPRSSEAVFQLLRAYRRRYVWRPSPVTHWLKKVRSTVVRYT